MSSPEEPPRDALAVGRDEASEKAGPFFEGLVRRPVALLVLFATLIVIGVITYRRLPLQLVPDGWTAPGLYIGIPNDGADAEENEEKIARIVEEQLRTLSGIESYESDSSEDMVDFWVEFDSSLDMDLAKADVRDRIERARPSLPPTVDRIFIWTMDGGSLPVSFFGILHPGDSGRTDFLMDQVVIPRLEAVPGISKVDVFGVLQDSVRILLDEEKVVAQNLNLGELIGRLARDNFAEPLGDVDDGGREVILRSDMRFKSLEEIAEYPLGNGMRIKDVAEVRRVKSIRDRLSRIDGAYSYFGVARKDSGSNVVETSRAFEQALVELEADPRLAGEFRFLPFFLQGEMIESSLDELKATAAWGSVLAIVILFVFLKRVRLTLCVACSIPVSVLMALAWEYFAGRTFNILTMCGITLGTGMLVDNAVVVVENIARLRNEGVPPLRAAALGTRQIALAVTLATLTSVVVFMPLIFMTGEPMLRAIFAAIGIPLSLSLIFSLLVAVVFMPVIAARLLGERPAAVERLGRVFLPVTRLPARAVAWCVGGLRLLWHAGLRAAFGASRAALAVIAPARYALALGALGGAALCAYRIAPRLDLGDALEPFGLAPSSSEGGAASLIYLLGLPAVLLALFVLWLPRLRRRPALAPPRPGRFVLRGDSLLDMTIEANRVLVTWTLQHRLRATVLATASFLTIFVAFSMTNIAAFGEDSEGDSSQFHVSFDAPFTLAEAETELSAYEEWLMERKESIGFDHWSNSFDERGGNFELYYDVRQDPDHLAEVQRMLKEELPEVPGHQVRFYDEEQATDRSKTVMTIRLTGPDSATLERLGVQAQAILERVPGLKGLNTAKESAPEQVRVDIDRDTAHDLGLNSDEVQQTIAYALHGFALPRYQEEGRDVPFQIEYDEDKVAGIASLKDLGIWSGSGTVPLSSFTQLSYAKGAHSINRRDGRTTFALTAEVEDPLRMIALTQAAHRALDELDLPRGYEVDQSDSAQSRQESEFEELKKALLLGIVLVFLIMAILFESVILPFTVLFTIPFAILGSIWTLALTGMPLDSMGWIGLIVLAGVVANHGIVLIDRIHRLHAAGVERSLAVVTGAGQRVRPVLMTSLTAIFGLIPMALAQPAGEGIDYRSLATIVAGGLACSTFFTLWVIPLAYTVLDDLGRVLAARFGWWLRPARPAPSVRQAGGSAEAPAMGRLE